MQNEESLNPHDGHRERLKNRAWADGLLSLPDHEVIELLLYFAFPRQNVNELAHKLIDRYGSVRGVLSASYDDLFCITGLGHSVSTLLNAFGRAVRAYTALPRDISPTIVNRSDAILYAASLFGTDRRPQTWVAMVNSGGVIAYSGRVFTGAVWYNERVRRFIVERVLSYNAHEVIIISRRGLDSSRPLGLDMESLKELADALSLVDAYIMDYIIIGGAKNISMRQVADIGGSRRESEGKSCFISESFFEGDGVREIKSTEEYMEEA